LLRGVGRLEPSDDVESGSRSLRPPDRTGTTDQQAGTVMHELRHRLGLHQAELAEALMATAEMTARCADRRTLPVVAAGGRQHATAGINRQ